MNRLLFVNLSRLKKNKVFWLGSALMFLLGMLLPVTSYLNMKRTGCNFCLEDSFFTYTIFVVVLLSAFCSLFIGTDYSDGTIRNKLAVGHTRSSIYLSNVITCIIANVLMCCIYFAAYFAFGIPLLGFFTVDIALILCVILCFLMTTLAFIGIFTLISMLSGNKAATAVACILCTFFFLFAGAFIESRLNEPETYSSYTYTDNFGTYYEPEQPNPNYITGKKREVYQFLDDFLPGCQALQLSSMKCEHPAKMASYSALIAILTTGAGLILFRKKDIK